MSWTMVTCEWTLNISLVSKAGMGHKKLCEVYNVQDASLRHRLDLVNKCASYFIPKQKERKKEEYIKNILGPCDIIFMTIKHI